jgi:bile acid:Na+ symporter, BASS family
MDIDAIRLNLNQDSIHVLQLIIAIIMFGVALDLKLSDFKDVVKKPKSLVAGLFGHYLLFPIFTYLLIVTFETRASISLGLAMVAICPAGNLANLFTHMGRGNTAVSVGLTSLTTLLAVFTMPVSLIFMGRFIPGSEVLLSEISINTAEIIQGVFVVLALPLMIGMLISKNAPGIALKLKKVMSKLSIIFLIIFIIGALAANFQHFIDYIHMIVGIVFVHNLLSLATGLIVGKLASVSAEDIKGITFPMSVKNTALGLALVFQFFEGLGGMALIVAWWGISQITLGLILSTMMKKKLQVSVA